MVGSSKKIYNCLFFLKNYGHIQIAITVFVLTSNNGFAIHDRRGYALAALSAVFLTEHQGCVSLDKKSANIQMNTP
jgi:hypothetical protein